MIDFDQDNGPTLGDLMHDKRFKLIVLGVMAAAIGIAVFMDMAGLVGKWG